MPKTTQRGSFLPKQITLPVTLYQDLILVMNCRWGRAPLSAFFGARFHSPCCVLIAGRYLPSPRLRSYSAARYLERLWLLHPWNPRRRRRKETAFPFAAGFAGCVPNGTRLRIRISRRVKGPGEASAGFTPVPFCCTGYWKLHGIKLTATKMR